MAESAVSQYEDQFICSVCLDRLKEPVTIPCGHSYCMSCITDCWGQKEQEPPYHCPQCRESFSQRPLLKKNTLIAEMMETLQKTSLQTAAVECDVCTTEKSRAVKSCLQCLASFCQTHLQLLSITLILKFVILSGGVVGSSLFEYLFVPPFSSDFCQLQLDPNTAHKKIILSERNRKASYSDKVQQYPDHRERFDKYMHVLCREGLNGRCYWEVECCGDDWSVAVSYRGISRKGKTDDCRLGFNNKSWRVTHCQQNFYFRHDKEHVLIRDVPSSRIGVYLDHRAGTLCFYSVSDTMTLLHRVQTTFTEPLYPAFGVASGSVRIIEQRGILKDQK
ncbi:stonustoxin subunit beta-like [Sinocyclocheilus grahami]|uniref:stonustoxin subunit beta-like n=1 Tax=Sinocyclocheilus grahami TaxID=75366 RepID=UPI0007AC734D|nr:PREDICTED: stonustoxin subunit beta-like [Sinocyclocheilus grahami]